MITLVDILAGKEARYQRQQKFREKHQTTLVSITINMPGPVKDLPITRRLRDYAVQEIKKRLHVIGEEQENLLTGPVALVAVEDDGSEAKRISIGIEESTSFARLLDIDVFESDGRLLSRQDQGHGRGCFVCGKNSLVCMREQKHTLAEVQLAVDNMLAAFQAYESRFISPDAEQIGALAVEAMLYEATCTPAPGLVDRANSGAHLDMDFYSFMASSASLAMPMARCAQAGMMHDGNLQSLLPVLRIITDGLLKFQRVLLRIGGVAVIVFLIFHEEI